MFSVLRLGLRLGIRVIISVLYALKNTKMIIFSTLELG